MGRRIGGKLSLCAAIVAAFTVVPATASAITVSGVTPVPANTQAGANSNLSLDFNLSGGQLKDLVIHLPPGLVGNPLATTTCTEAELNANTCPAASRVGAISNTINGVVPAAGQVFNVVPRAGEPARFGFVLSTGLGAPIILQSPAALRPTDFGLDTILNEVPDNVMGIPITITRIELDLQGQVGSPPQGFLRNPTSCGTNTVSVDATPYSGSPGSASGNFQTVNCGSVPFSPEFKATIKQSANFNNAVELSTTISQTIEEAGLKRAQVTLPAQVSGDGVALANTCSISDFQGETCPPSTIAGDAVAGSPLQAEPLRGNVYILPSSTSSLPDIGVDLRGSLGLKLKGALGLSTELRPVVTFDGLPDIPISEFTLTFAGGPTGVNDASPDLCSEKPPPAFNTNFLAHTGAVLDLETPAKVTCDKAKGGKKKPPKATLKLGRLSSDQPTLKLKVKAGSSKLRTAKLKLPTGLSFDKDGSGASAKADGKALKGKALKLGSRSLALKTKGARSLVAKVGKGTLIRNTNLNAKKLRIKLKLRDVAGKSTKLTLRPK